MADDTSKTQLDRRLISLSQPYEVRDWCKSLGCSKEELETAVKAVGPSADKVREYLASR
jgi:hypothetical protein